MPKRPVKREFGVGEIITTLLAGHHVYRPDLNYPESHSDMTGAVEGLLLKYDVTLRPLPRDREELYDPYPTCVVCGAPSHFSYGGIAFCGNDHARQFGEEMVRSNTRREAPA